MIKALSFRSHNPVKITLKNIFGFSSKIRSPLDLSLFKSDEGVSLLRKSLSARFDKAGTEKVSQVQAMLNEHR